MIYRYAVMSGHTVVGISQYTASVDSPRLIEIHESDIAIGDLYNGSEFYRPDQDETAE
ncbi:hypothetical protein GCM10009412_38580 [Aeromonas salmonicida subsp. achromogenes]